MTRQWQCYVSDSPTVWQILNLEKSYSIHNQSGFISLEIKYTYGTID